MSYYANSSGRDLLDVLREHATNDGVVDLDSLTAAGVDLAAITPTLQSMRGQVTLEYQPGPGGLEVDSVTLLGAARRGLPDPPRHPGY